MKPIGFYVSVPEGHQDYQTLKALEEHKGSFFEEIPTNKLKEILQYCAESRNPERVVPKVFNLSSQTCFDLIPFLHQVIKERLVKDATN